MWVKNQQIGPYMEQWTGSKLEKEYKAIYYHPVYLTYMQSTSCKMPGWMNPKLESRLSREMSSTSDMQMINTLMAESEEELKSLLMKVKEESEKAGLTLNIQKMKIMASGPITSWQTEGEKVEAVTDFIFLGSEDSHCSHEMKRCLLLGRKVMADLESILKSKDTTLLTVHQSHVCIVKAIVYIFKDFFFSVVMYGCKGWTIKKAEHRRTDAFKLWC